MEFKWWWHLTRRRERGAFKDSGEWRRPPFPHLPLDSALLYSAHGFPPSSTSQLAHHLSFRMPPRSIGLDSIE